MKKKERFALLFFMPSREILFAITIRPAIFFPGTENRTADPPAQVAGRKQKHYGENYLFHLPFLEAVQESSFGFVMRHFSSYFVGFLAQIISGMGCKIRLV